MRLVYDVALFGLFATLFLGPIYLFASYRVRRAHHRGTPDYVPHADPWLSAIVGLTSAGLAGLLYLIG
jgi:hypothetical protein